MKVDLSIEEWAFILEYLEAAIEVKKSDKTDGCGEEGMQAIMNQIIKQTYPQM